ncbi:uncharacterized protein LACBIDRAFT_298343 [Laccaria bicolor S238N-H82]|uniref:Predicted protein n=1 Tax=Laccaria bicolor (strain S238N-H82 / ATCC MYA-4686) TaxID=486041 RepID=B0E3B2_LACBS|nr:uncharacterized protein LACBIDRAFT_298343 [Laccaria bicolor S238N-H82]EDQ98671.1 predicted protein [Laccaria bicolor S238N-H82]|eukprot:XP_001890684.1 predicted protein [Laccaria bicolor S238N-H82]
MLHRKWRASTPMHTPACRCTLLHAKNLTGVPYLHTPARSWHAESVVPMIQMTLHAKYAMETHQGSDHVNAPRALLSYIPSPRTSGYSFTLWLYKI